MVLLRLVLEPVDEVGRQGAVGQGGPDGGGARLGGGEQLDQPGQKAVLQKKFSSKATDVNDVLISYRRTIMAPSVIKIM